MMPVPGQQLCLGLGKTAGRVAVFTGQIEDFRDALDGGASIREVIEQILADTGYKEELEAEGEIEVSDPYGKH